MPESMTLVAERPQQIPAVRAENRGNRVHTYDSLRVHHQQLSALDARLAAINTVNEQFATKGIVKRFFSGLVKEGHVQRELASLRQEGSYTKTDSGKKGLVRAIADAAARKHEATDNKLMRAITNPFFAGAMAEGVARVVLIAAKKGIVVSQAILESSNPIVAGGSAMLGEKVFGRTRKQVENTLASLPSQADLDSPSTKPEATGVKGALLKTIKVADKVAAPVRRITRVDIEQKIKDLGIHTKEDRDAFLLYVENRERLEEAISQLEFNRTLMAGAIGFVGSFAGVPLFRAAKELGAFDIASRIARGAAHGIRNLDTRHTLPVSVAASVPTQIDVKGTKPHTSYMKNVAGKDIQDLSEVKLPKAGTGGVLPDSSVDQRMNLSPHVQMPNPLRSRIEGIFKETATLTDPKENKSLATYPIPGTDLSIRALYSGPFNKPDIPIRPVEIVDTTTMNPISGSKWNFADQTNGKIITMNGDIADNMKVSPNFEVKLTDEKDLAYNWNSRIGIPSENDNIGTIQITKVTNTSLGKEITLQSLDYTSSNTPPPLVGSEVKVIVGRDSTGFFLPADEVKKNKEMFDNLIKIDGYTYDEKTNRLYPPKYGWEISQKTPSTPSGGGGTGPVPSPTPSESPVRTPTATRTATSTPTSTPTATGTRVTESVTPPRTSATSTTVSGTPASETPPTKIPEATTTPNKPGETPPPPPPKDSNSLLKYGLYGLAGGGIAGGAGLATARATGDLNRSNIKGIATRIGSGAGVGAVAGLAASTMGIVPGMATLLGTSAVGAGIEGLPQVWPAVKERISRKTGNNEQNNQDDDDDDDGIADDPFGGNPPPAGGVNNGGGGPPRH